MKQINLIVGCHSHQPVGNFDFVFAEAYEKSYKPFIDVLERFPAVRVTLHYTGPLWDWFLENEPGYVERLAGLAQRGQVEIMGGGYYEPLLCAIPERDAQAQIHRMQDFCQEHLGVKPRGMWLTERVWEPHMARILAQSGVEYAALDDSHFLCSGLRPDQLYGYYMTEEEGEVLKVFPIQEKLRYLVPFHQVHETIDYLRDLATEEGERCAVLHDDGEKFGIWPGTFKSVYEDGWLEEFFQALTENQEWLHCVTYSQYMDKQPPAGRTYITCASYQEMMAWALPTERQRELRDARDALREHPDLYDRCASFIRGGFWRNFLAKYPEANAMQKRMLRVSRRVEKLSRHCEDEAYKRALNHLHRGQCNCAYWHGQFGGLYLNHLRTAIYQELIRADLTLDALDPLKEPVRVEAVDFDGDGQKECILENASLTAFIAPHDGGTLFELDYKPGAFNLTNTLARREEPYHDALVDLSQEDEVEGEEQFHSIHEPFRPKESGLTALLFQDPYRRASLRDHLLPADTTVEALYRNEMKELAPLPSACYEMSLVSNGVALEAAVPLAGSAGEFKICKTITLKSDDSVIEISYDIQNNSDTELSGILSPEFGINFLTGSADDRYYHTEDRALGKPMLGEHGMEKSLSHFALRDGWQRLETGIRLDSPASVAFFPLETISQSECGQERVHQGCVIFPQWPVRLAPRASARHELTWYVRSIDSAQD